MDPITRKETFLAKAGGQDVTTPTPVTREEFFLNEIAKGGGDERTVVPVTFEWDAETQQYSPADVPVDVYNHPEKYDLLCTFSGGKYGFVTTMFRYGSNYVNIPLYFGIMDYEAPSNFVVTIPTPDSGVEVTPAFFVGTITNKFIVTFTPTNETGTDGTTDKTGAELYQAYKAGKEIIFSLPYLDSVAYISNVTDIGTAVQPSATLTFSPDGTNYVLAYVYTQYAYSDLDSPLSYSAYMFALTPVS